MFRLNLCLSLLCLSLFFVTKAFAQELCQPVMGGAIINLAAECFNDSTAFVVDPSVADEYGWQYSLDNDMDGVNGGTVGDTVYEIHGIAFRETQETLCFVVNGHLPLEGTVNNRAADKNIGWGDLFINMTSGDFLPTSDLFELYGVRFADTNDSLATERGVYSSVAASSVTSTNSGFTNWNAYKNHVEARGKTPELGKDFGTDQTYFDGTISHNVISEGSHVSDIQLLTEQELADLNYDNTFYDGDHHIGFCFQKQTIIDPCGVEGGDGSTCRNCAGVLCGEGLKEADDEDSDGTLNCEDGCPTDPTKVQEGICGCGVSDTDTDLDGTADCNDLCVDDEEKIAPGICGCGVLDTDTDLDGTADCNDLCVDDEEKTAPGICGCGVSDIDTDLDGTADCNDLCVDDEAKLAPGLCGCGTADTDADGDGTPDCLDSCPADMNKTAPGACGCGISEDFCQDIACGNGIPQEGEQCDDGNTSNEDDCSTTCEFTEQLLADSVCEKEDVSGLQRQLDGFAKRADKLARRAAQKTAVLAKARGVNLNPWKKKMIELTGFFEETAWVAIWIPSSIRYTCNDAAQKLCEVVSDTTELETYQTNMDLLVSTSFRIARKYRRELLRAGLGLRKFKKFKKQIANLERKSDQLLAEMPLTNLKCPDGIA